MRRVLSQANAAIAATVRRTWPRTTEAQLRAAIVAAIPEKATRADLLRIALATQRAMHTQLAAIIEGFPRWRNAAESETAAEWVDEAWDGIIAMLTATKTDAITTDGGPVSLLNSTMGRLRALRASNAEIMEVLDLLKEVAPDDEIGAIVRVRARVAGWAAKANQRKQEAIGVKRYIWRTRQDSRVRPGHARLEGTVQRWAKPPDVGGGRMLHPGEDWNCRCIAVPIETLKTARRIREMQEEG